MFIYAQNNIQCRSLCLLFFLCLFLSLNTHTHTHTHTYIYIHIYIHHHHHIVLAARVSLTLSRNSPLSSIALGRSSGQHPVSSHSCWMYVRAGRPAFARPCVGIHKSTSLMSSSLLLQQCPACLVRLTWIVFGIGGRWPYSWCLVGCCCQDFAIQTDLIKYDILCKRGLIKREGKQDIRKLKWKWKILS